MDLKNLTPLLQQYFNLKQKYKNYLLLFRVGDFYEAYGQDAITLSKAVEIVLTKKTTNNLTIEMAGVPYHAIDNYLKTLIDKNFNIAIAEQLEDPKKAKGLVKRGVKYVITPGTITKPEFINKKENNYILSIYKEKNNFYITYTDVLERILYISKISNSNELNPIIYRINPKEIIITNKEIFSYLDKNNIKLTKLLDKEININYAKKLLQQATNSTYLYGYLDIENTGNIISSAILLTYFYSLNKNEVDFKIKEINFSKYVILDPTTIKNLEIFKTLLENQTKGSLIWAIDKTKTPMGARLLKNWIKNPLKDIDKINQRLNYVQFLTENSEIINEINSKLNYISDIERLVSKVIYETATALDIINLKNSIKFSIELKKIIQKYNIFKHFIYIDNEINILVEKIENTLKEDVSNNFKDKDFIKKGCNKELDTLFEKKEDILNQIFNIEIKEKEKTKIKNLKIGYNQVFGYYIEITKKHTKNIPTYYIRKQTLANTERYITQELKILEEKLQIITEKIKEKQLNIYTQLLSDILQIKDKLEILSKNIAKLDILNSFAYISHLYNYTKPIIHKGKSLIIKDGRHIVVERYVSEFIPNNLNLSEDKFMILLTGPNMGGKSTYLRQNALIILLAHIGCFVPASYAKIPITDRIFSRVGASDNLHKGRSTYLVEMQETANIVNNATKNSFIILDEIGRGTSTYDGLATAWATIEYIIKHIKAKTLFATHFHELAKLEKLYPQIENYTMSVKESDDNIIFLKKAKKGWADKSYGIYVAKLANLPDEIIKRAENLLKQLQEKEKININTKKEKQIKQVKLFNYDYDKNILEIIKILKNLDILNITPLQAINLLNELKSKINY